ncbi:MAG: endonuclease [Gelidibacter sp.]
MKSIFTFLFFLLITSFMMGQVVINELDCDTPGIDDKEFVELLSDTPNFPLDGYVLVFFNGSNSGANKSYFAIDLDGHETDINGLLLIGSNTVSPVPQLLIAPNTIQNGADAVALYQADDLDFEEPTVAYVDETLIDVLLYQTNDSDGLGLQSIFSAFDPNIQIINEGPGNNTNSIQRFVDGTGNVTYTATTPTPRQLNDGSGIVLNGVFIDVPENQYNEGDVFDITLTTEQPTTSDLVLNLSLNNGTFNASDYSGNLTLTIPSGQSSVTTTITLVNDNDDEGDEVMKISMSGLPPEYLALNNHLKIRVVDDDFQVAPFGTPINPTYGIVQSTQPDGYYDSMDGLSGDALKQAMQNIIAEEGVVRAQTYTDIIDILKEADQNPANSNQVWLVYLEKGRAKLDFQTTSNNIGTWNREHTFPRSRGGYNSIDADNIADGRDVYWNTNADSLRHGNSEAHMLRAVDGPENSSRNNLFYGQYNGPAGTLGKFKGDVARSVFFMAVRYNGLSIVNGYPEETVGEFGDLQTLLDWTRNDPPDDFEMNRNNVVYTWQYNRNPFIDHPELIEYLWGNMVGQVWNQNLSVADANALHLKIYPNPTANRIYIAGIKELTTIEIYSAEGRLVSKRQANTDVNFNLDVSSGIYVMKLSSNGKSVIKKMIVE